MYNEMTGDLDWSKLDKIRGVVERYYLRNSAKDNINIPKYDMFVTILRDDYTRIGFDLKDEKDIYRLWGVLKLMAEGIGSMLTTEIESNEELVGALKVAGTYGNMLGLFMREITKNVPSIPPIQPVPELGEGDGSGLV